MVSFQLEEQQRLEAEAAERQRLMELQAKTPEVTITVLKNGVPHNLGLPPQQNPAVKNKPNKGTRVQRLTRSMIVKSRVIFAREKFLKRHTIFYLV